MLQKRVLIVDVMHLCYKAAFSMPPLSATVRVGDTLQVVNTSVTKFVSNQVYRWSKGGYFPTVLCFDSVGGNKSRKAYFAQKEGVNEKGEPVSYKGGRKSENDTFYDAVNLTLNLLFKSGICCLRAEKYEADDLIKASVDLAKKTYPGMPIDIVTGDCDLVPLVDDTVSVFLSSRKATYAESDDLKKTHYVQITPDNYEEYINDLSSFRNLYVPYNTVLLTKLLRGDKSDNIQGYPKFTPTKFKNLIWDMQNDGVDLADICRYDAPTETICYKDTLEPVPAELIDTVPRDSIMIKYGEPPALTKLCEVLGNYLDAEVIDHVRFIYNGINLNGAYINVPDMFKRRPAKLTVQIKGFDKIELRKVLEPLRINLPQNV